MKLQSSRSMLPNYQRIHLHGKNLEDNIRNIAVHVKKAAIICLIRQLNASFVICSYVYEDDSSNNS